MEPQSDNLQLATNTSQYDHLHSPTRWYGGEQVVLQTLACGCQWPATASNDSDGPPNSHLPVLWLSMDFIRPELLLRLTGFARWKRVTRV